MNKESIIQKTPLFASLPPSEIHHLAETLRPVNFPAQAMLFREGDYGDLFFIVLDGEIEIIKAMDTPDEHLISVRGPGEYIGEMSLLNPDGKRTASVRAHTDVQALEMTRADFDALLHRHPKMAYEMTRVLSTRLTAADNATIRDLQEKNRQLQLAYDELRAAQAQIVEKEKLEHELQLARQIQESILPRELPKISGFDFGAKMIPTRAVGGDFFDFVPIDKDHIGIAIADVSDKGVPAAIFMALTRSLLRAEAMRSHSPNHVLQNVNSLLLEMNDAGMFVTVVYGVLNCATREFHYARAGHDEPIFIDAANKLTVPKLKPSHPLGLFPGLPLDVQRAQLAADDMLVLFTDGITEAMNSQNELFGTERLHKSLANLGRLSAQQLCERVIDDVIAYRGSAPQSDDITMVAARIL
jgi:sigma-B regulation protein RsbU (phosphoserine phosphatase)